MSETTLSRAPYKGLMPYSEHDAPFFYGREAEREIITANLISSRFTVLYGPSGVGKSSVLHAGVAHHLRLRAQQNWKRHGAPELAVVVYSDWRDDPVAGLLARVQESVRAALNGQPVVPASPPATLSDALKLWAERVEGDLFIILDQFEEYFLYHAHDAERQEGAFGVEFPRVVDRVGLRVNFLVSIREDALAKLDYFEGRIPNLFDNYLRIEHLDRNAARAAIEKPLQQFNRQQAEETQHVHIEPALVEAVLDQVKTGQVVLTASGRGQIEEEEDGDARIETPFLQLVMTRLWDEEQRVGSRTLRLDTLNRLGGAERIVRTHLDATMNALPPNERETAARVFHFLVTPSGTKIAHTVADLRAYAQVPENRLQQTMEKLSGGDVRILRPVAPPPGEIAAPRYEIFHDVLAPAILDWRERYLQRARARRFRFAGLAIALAVFLVIAGLVINLQSSRVQLEQKAQEAQNLSQAVLSQATSELTPEPTMIALRATAAAVATSAAQVLCAGAPSIRFSVSPETITAGDATTLSWDSATNITSVKIEPDIGAVTVTGTLNVKPLTTTTYTLTASGCGGVVNKQVTVRVNPATPLPTLTPTMAPTAIPSGLYVTDLRLNPDRPAFNSAVSFFVTFANTTSTFQNFKWLVYIFRADTPSRANNQTTAVQGSFPAGSGEYSALGTFRYGATGNQCEFFFARVGWLDADNKTTFFTQSDGKVFEKGFSVCDVSVIPTSTLAPPTPTPVPPTPAPGLFVTDLRLQPERPAFNSDMSFFATFANTTSTVQNFKWLVYIFRADTPSRANNQTTAMQGSFPVGSGEYGALGTFRYGVTGNQCEFFFARVGWLDADNKTTFFTQPDGKVFEKGFSVCDALVIPTPTPMPPTPTSVPPTPRPDLYVTQLRIDPPSPVRSESPEFYVTFSNTTAAPRTHRWCVEIWDPRNSRNSFGVTTCRSREMPVGVSELDATGWRIRVGQCLLFRARVVWEDEGRNRIPFTQPDGSDLWLDFQVCP